MQQSKIIIIGAGAAGFFAAITAAECNPSAQVVLLEKTQVVLSKVRISGGGRCNVTHACFDPKQLVKHYPRGEKALLGPFYRFQPKDTIDWFNKRGVTLKTEEDGRMFPVTDNSQTIINCLMKAAEENNVDIKLGQKIIKISKENDNFHIYLNDGQTLECHSLLLATGSSSQGHQWAKELGHTLIPSVPSLFTFNVPSSPLLELAGISIEEVELHIQNTNLKQKGPLLLTHWGFSGPAALKLSAWGARYLHDVDYKATLVINWLPAFNQETTAKHLVQFKEKEPNKILSKESIFNLPKNLWKKLIEGTEIDPNKRMAQISMKYVQSLAKKLCHDHYTIEGKTTYKQEFVTAGGIALDEINFQRLESKLCPNLFFAGEILDIDGVTGGFNFQNAWTTGWIAGQAMAQL